MIRWKIWEEEGDRMQFLVGFDILLLIAAFGGSAQALGWFIFLTGFIIFMMFMEYKTSYRGESSGNLKYPPGCDEATKKIIDDLNKK